MLGHFREELEERQRRERVLLGKSHTEAVRGIKRSVRIGGRAVVPAR